MQRHRTRGGTAVAIVVTAVIAIVAAPAPAERTGAAASCHGLADMPRPVDLHSTLPRLYAWGEFHCDAQASLAVQVCGIRYTPTGLILDSKVVWCIHRIVRVVPERPTFVRTPVHACTPGKEYVSDVRVIGQPWDRGPSRRCRSL
jgi:hypothetical protein